MAERQSDTETVWTVPNTVSYIRLTVFLPLSLGLIAAGYAGWSLVALFFMGVSDGIDGFLARKLHQETKLGSELDAVSDRASVILVALAIALAGLLPWVFLITIVAVDLVMLLVGITVFRGYPTIHVNWIGKVRTALLLLGLPALLLAEALQSEPLRMVALVLVLLGTIGHVAAGVSYVYQLLAQRGPKEATA